MTVPTSYVALANRLADAAGSVIRPYFRQDAGLEFKPDASPVTRADTEAEAVMRSIIETEHPEAGILGEEGNDVNPNAEYIWVLDPVDGTKSFVTGKPQFATLIGLSRANVPILGVIDQPVMGERWLGGDGYDTTFNGTPIRTRPCTSIADAWLSATAPDMFQDIDQAAFARLNAAARHTVFGGDGYGYGLLANGYSDIVCEAKLNPWDLCALGPVIINAGGKFTDWSGASVTLESDGHVLGCGDARVHAEALTVLAG